MKLQELVGKLSNDELSLKKKYTRSARNWWETKMKFEGETKGLLEITKDNLKLALLYSLARKINNIRDKRIDIFEGNELDKFEGETIGMLAEILVANDYSVNWDKETHLENTNKGYDCIIKDKRIDVKYNLCRNNGKSSVVVSESKNINSCDYYFFLQFIGRSKNNKIYLQKIGYISSKNIIKDDNKIEGRKGYFINKEKLRKFRKGE